MKFKVNQLVKKPLEIQGRATELITMMVTDLEKGTELKIKAWKNKWSDTLEIGKEYAANTYVKKDRDGMDEMYFENPNKGSGSFGGGKSVWASAYELAIEWCKATKTFDCNQLDGYATKFKVRLENGPVYE